MDYTPPVSAIHANVNEVCVQGFTKQEDFAQYGGSDYKNAVCVARGISLQQAFAIAEHDPTVDYFVFLKGGCMVLPISEDIPFDPTSDSLGLVSYISYRRDSDGSIGYGGCRVFHHGDAVFFRKEGKWLGTAPGLADTYSKK